MELKFTKMQSLGNDYIFINGFEYPYLINKAQELAIKLSDRRFGIGGDGIIFALQSKNADLMMRIFNADGSEAEMCGNGIRELVLFALENNIISKDKVEVETLAGIKTIEVDREKNVFRVDMGFPILEPSKIPAVAEINKGHYAVKNILVDDKNFEFTLVSMGNPHAVTFVDKVSDFNVEKYGKIVENMTEIFPKRTNVEFIEIVSRNLINMRVWERGSGETFACGTGACASVVASVLNGYTDNKVTVKLRGGNLYIELIDGKVFMTGDAHKVFDGTIII